MTAILLSAPSGHKNPVKLPTLYLRPHEDRRVRAGHPWIYANEVDSARSPLTGFEPGAACRVADTRGAVLGVAHVNPAALLCGRLISSQFDGDIDKEWVCRRLRAALALRERVYPGGHYRLIHGEGDGFPGLVIDRYGDTLVVQMNTAGIEKRKAVVLDAIREVMSPRGIWLRNDVSVRELEGLPLYMESVGDPAESVDMDEDGVRFRVPMTGGQKTGWYYDQRDNRRRLQPYAKDARVLDVFSYVGAWALRAGGFGARELTCIDASATALERARDNADLNGMTLETVQGEALAAMKALASEKRQFDVVVVDPPALIKRRKDHKSGLTLYRRLNRAALELVVPGGVLVSCSCSYHLDVIELQRVVARAAQATGRRLQILDYGGQGADHPIHPAVPETRYLKAVFCHSPNL